MQRFQHDHGQEEAKGDAQGAHDGMQQKRQQQEWNRLPAFARQYPRNRQQNEGRGHIARVQMLIDQVERRSGHRQGEHGGYQGNSSPLRSRLGKELPRNLQQPKTISAMDANCQSSSVPATGMPVQVDKPGNPLVEEGGLHLERGKNWGHGGKALDSGWLSPRSDRCRRLQCRDGSPSRPCPAR